VAVVGLGAFDCFWDQPDPARNPRVLWRVPGIGWARPVFDSQAVYFPGAHHELVAVDKQSGRVRWSARVPYEPRCFTLDTAITYGYAATWAAGTVVVMDDGLFGFDPATGRHRWTWRPPVGCMAEVSWPGSDGQTVYAGASRGSVYALDGATGALRWHGQFLPESAAVAYSPIHADGVVYAAFNVQVAAFPFDSGGVVALDAATGSRLWIHYFPRAVPGLLPRGTGRVAIAGPLVFAPSDDGIVYALDRTTGARVWEAAPDGSDRPVAVSGPYVVVGSTTGLLVGLAGQTGAEAWRNGAGSSVVRLVADSQFAYAHVGFAQLAVFDARTRQLRWSFGSSPAGGTVGMRTCRP